MAARIDGSQVFQETERGNLLPVWVVFGSFREAVKEKMKMRSYDGGTYQIQSVINKNNSK